MRFDFRTFLVTATLVSVTLVDVAHSSIFHKSRLVRVYRETAPERTQLPDGTRFEKYAETGDQLPPLPVGEEEADDLNDPRIGHLDKNGGIAVPVDENGNVLKGYEYLLKPITILIDLDEKDENGRPKIQIESLTPDDSSSSSSSQQIYDPYPGLSQQTQNQNQNQNSNQNQNQQNQQIPDQQHQNQLKPEPLPEEQETAGDEYDDIPNEPQEPLPQVPDLPKADYTDSQESDEEMKVLDEEEDDEREEEPRKEVGGAGQTGGVVEVIVPSTLIEQPIVTDNVQEKNQSDSDVQENDAGDQNGEADENDKTIDIPKNRVDSVAEASDTDDAKEPREEEEESIGLTEEDVERLAEDLRKSVFENVMNKASEFANFKDEEDVADLPIDPNSIVSEPEAPALAELPIETQDDVDDVDSDSGSDSISNSDINSAAEAAAVAVEDALDGVVLPDQSLSDEEIAAIAADSLKPNPPPEKVPSAPVPNVRGGRIGSGVKPNAVSKYNVVLQILTVSLALLFL